MADKIYDHHDLYKKYDMTGEIHIGTGIVQVYDIFNPLPKFMLDADIIFTDPPYNKSALSSYYTKADLKEKPDSFESFFYRLIECLDLINAKYVILEVGCAQEKMYLDVLRSLYKNVMSFDSFYYKKSPCKIIVASKHNIPDVFKNIPTIDEEKVIDYICKNVDFECIADLCMGKGLVGFYANKYGKRFVGTELNKKRLAVLLERITTGKRGNIN